jgi:hypothetical protein
MTGKAEVVLGWGAWPSKTELLQGCAGLGSLAGKAEIVQGWGATFVEGTVCSTLYIFGAFVKNKVGIAVWIHIWVLCVPLVFISVFVPVPCCFYCYGSVI